MSLRTDLCNRLGRCWIEINFSVEQEHTQGFEWTNTRFERQKSNETELALKIWCTCVSRQGLQLDVYSEYLECEKAVAGFDMDHSVVLKTEL